MPDYHVELKVEKRHDGELVAIYSKEYIVEAEGVSQIREKAAEVLSMTFKQEISDKPTTVKDTYIDGEQGCVSMQVKLIHRPIFLNVLWEKMKYKDWMKNISSQENKY